MRIVVTSGAEGEMLDKLAVSIAEAALARDWEVDYVALEGKAQPADIAGSNRLRIHNADSPEIYADTIKSLANDKPTALISADVDTTDIVTAVKTAYPRLAVMGLKAFEQDAAVGDVLDTSYASILRNKLSLVVGIIPDEINNPDRSVILTVERGIQPVKGMDGFADAFFELFESRVNNKHNRTDLQKVDDLAAIAGDVEEMISRTREWAGWSLFPVYESKDPKYPGAEFGFVAKRTDAGTLITGRGSNKESPTIDDFALIERIDDDGTIHAKSTKLKASLNAPLAHRIFEQRPEVQYIVHSHNFIPEGENAASVTAPGTQKDWEGIKALVESGAKVINQPAHGTLILLESPDELMPLLKRNQLYAQRSDLYDKAYARFQDKKTSLEEAVEALGLPVDAKVLDLCCGTGASTMALQALGFTNIDIADGSASMLAVAEERLGKQGITTRLETLDGVDGQYDLITVRQAINYVAPDDLPAMAQAIADHLEVGGRFVFNTFKPLQEGSKSRDSQHEDASVLIRTREDNYITRDRVLHTQRSEIIDFEAGRWDAVVDVNEFYQHPAILLENALKKAGFEVNVKTEGQSISFTSTLRERKEQVEPVKISGRL